MDMSPFMDYIFKSLYYRKMLFYILPVGIPTLELLSSLWKMMAFVSWDDIPKWMENHKIPWFQTTNQRLLVYKPL